MYMYIEMKTTSARLAFHRDHVHLAVTAYFFMHSLAGEELAISSSTSTNWTHSLRRACGVAGHCGGFDVGWCDQARNPIILDFRHTRRARLGFRGRATLWVVVPEDKNFKETPIQDYPTLRKVKQLTTGNKAVVLCAGHPRGQALSNGFAVLEHPAEPDDAPKKHQSGNCRVLELWRSLKIGPQNINCWIQDGAPSRVRGCLTKVAEKTMVYGR